MTYDQWFYLSLVYASAVGLFYRFDMPVAAIITYLGICVERVRER